jgi:hypothetical protein
MIVGIAEAACQRERIQCAEGKPAVLGFRRTAAEIAGSASDAGIFGQHPLLSTITALKVFVIRGRLG